MDARHKNKWSGGGVSHDAAQARHAPASTALFGCGHARCSPLRWSRRGGMGGLGGHLSPAFGGAPLGARGPTISAPAAAADGTISVVNRLLDAQSSSTFCPKQRPSPAIPHLGPFRLPYTPPSAPQLPLPTTSSAEALSSSTLLSLRPSAFRNGWRARITELARRRPVDSCVVLRKSGAMGPSRTLRNMPPPSLRLLPRRAAAVPLPRRALVALALLHYQHHALPLCRLAALRQVPHLPSKLPPLT